MGERAYKQDMQSSLNCYIPQSYTIPYISNKLAHFKWQNEDRESGYESAGTIWLIKATVCVPSYICYSNLDCSAAMWLYSSCGSLKASPKKGTGRSIVLRNQVKTGQEPDHILSCKIEINTWNSYCSLTVHYINQKLMKAYVCCLKASV